MLIVGAAVLGVVAGTCVGYQVQAGREPTPLPPLSQPVLPRATGPAPEPLSAAQDRKVRTEGDLRKLLLKKPAGAKKLDWPTEAGGWLDISAYAGTFTEPSRKFSSLVSDEFRRAAVVGWKTGSSYSVEIRLVQFRHEETLAAVDSVNNHKDWAEKDDHVESRHIPGTGEGMAYAHPRPETRPGYEPLYRAQAHALRGDIAMEIWISGDRPIGMETVMDLAERQMERL
ncbi:membrane protein [Streptomyces sp. AS58]|nr:membrane protein [Streptomyces sp. AS58]